MMQIAENAGIDGGIVVEKVRIFRIHLVIFPVLGILNFCIAWEVPRLTPLFSES